MFPAHMPPELAAHLRDMGIAMPAPAKSREPAPQPLPPVRFDADGEPNF
jgi:hypothetical protein